MTLLVQKFLRLGKTLKDLEIEHGVFSHVQNGKINLNYGMIEAKDSDPLSSQCRGLILDEKTFDVIACPLFRFFNHGQGSVPEDFDWNSAVAESKLDGSMLNTYWHNDCWFVGTRGRPEADGNIDNGDLTFAILTNTVIQKQFGLPNLNEFMNYYFSQEAQEHTFVFELTSPINRIVCKYNDFKLTLLAVRNIKTLKEDDPKNWLSVGQDLLEIPIPKTYDFKNINHLLDIVNNWSPEEHEGVVLKDKNFNRIKVKNISYVAYNKLRDSLSSSFRGCVEIILTGKDDDVIAMVPDFIADRIRKIKPLIKEVLKRTQDDFEKLNHIENMKEYALEAQKCLWPAALFALKRNKTPDLMTYAMGNERDTGKNKIPSCATDTLLELCRKIDPEFDKI